MKPDRAVGSAPAANAPSFSSLPPTLPSSMGRRFLVGLGIAATFVLVAVVGAGLFRAHLARQYWFSEKNGSLLIHTPYEQLETGNPDAAVRELGVKTYPGARLLPFGAVSWSSANSHFVSAEFESDDPTGKVAEFYKADYPDADVSVQNQGQARRITSSQRSGLTIVVDIRNGKTHVAIARLGGLRPTGQ